MIMLTWEKNMNVPCTWVTETGTFVLLVITAFSEICSQYIFLYKSNVCNISGHSLQRYSICLSITQCCLWVLLSLITLHICMYSVPIGILVKGISYWNAVSFSGDTWRNTKLCLCLLSCIEYFAQNSHQKCFLL
jgi:hypothetical protein